MLNSNDLNLLTRDEFLREYNCYISKDVKLGKNVVIYENNHIEGDCEIGDNTVLLPGNFIVNSKIGENSTVHNSVINDSLVKNNCSIGPFARLRPNSVIEDSCKIGNFVEIKNATLGKGTKASHLSYVGDCDVGEDCNIGCGVIFANYDGKKKHRSKVGNHVFVGSNSNIIAPVIIADGTYICAGTTVTKDTDKEDFTIGRSRQQNLPNRASRYW